MEELDKLVGRLQARIIQMDVPPAGSDWFRYKGAETAANLVRNLAFGIGHNHSIVDTENSIMRHDQAVDVSSNQEGEEDV